MITALAIRNENHKTTINTHKSQHGFTLVELLVVITIIGILIALLLPAVQAAREAARRMQCQNNIKQVGLAVLNYESQYKTFPPSSIWAPNVTSSNFPGDQNAYRANWVIMILPFMDQQALYDKFDFKQSISGSTTANASNATARGTQIPTMLCPSDPYNRKPFMGSSSNETSGFGDNWARGNYAANGAIGQMDAGSVNTSYNSFPAALPDSAFWKYPCIRGMMGANCAVKMADILDGTSNTIMIGEVRAGIVTCDSRGVWALSGGSSALWGCSSIGSFDDYGPNNPAANSDDMIAGDAITTASGGSTALMAADMPCNNVNSGSNDQITARSLHPDGVNTCFADGSVHWISDYIQTTGSSMTLNADYTISKWNLSVWDRLMASGDGQIVKGNSY